MTPEDIQLRDACGTHEAKTMLVEAGFFELPLEVVLLEVERICEPGLSFDGRVHLRHTMNQIRDDPHGWGRIRIYDNLLLYTCCVRFGCGASPVPGGTLGSTHRQNADGSWGNWARAARLYIGGEGGDWHWDNVMPWPGWPDELRAMWLELCRKTREHQRELKR